MPEETSFGQWLRQRRRLLDLTQRALADQVGCARITLRRIESGALKPSKELASIFLEKLGVAQKELPQWISFARGLSGFPSQSISSLKKPESNLPISLTSFIGRGKEQSEVIQLIAKHRLVTLTGSGGIGKTRLSLQVGEKLLKDYPDGGWFVALDSLSDAALVPPTVAAVFDIRESADRPVLEILIRVLREKTTLLILDNCEHLVDACAHLITTLLTNCPNLKILTTSREALGVEGEVIYTTPSLAIPGSKNIESINQLTQYESVALFTERAMLTMPSFSLTYDKAAPVVEICHTLDGIPLAIELTAARVDILHVNEILEQLKHCLDLLISNNRIVQPKHQSMRASLDWSWGLLTENEQVFLQQLSVFAGGWTLKSAQAICDGDVLGLTSALTKKSLIVVDQESGRKTRYRFHEIVRQYAHEKLVGLGEKANICTRHLNYFLQFSEQAEPALKGPTQMEWYIRLGIERDNIRTALEWANETSVEAGLLLAGRLHHLWDNIDLREGSYWLSIFLQKAESLSYPKARANALYAHGSILMGLQQFDVARSAAKECVELYRVCDDQQGEVDGLLLLSITLNPKERLGLIQRALDLAQSLDDKHRQANALWHLGWVAHDKNKFIYWDRAIAFFRTIGDDPALLGRLSSMGNWLLLYGDFESAQKYLGEAGTLIQEDSSVELKIYFFYARGRLALILGEFEKAHNDFQECIKLSIKSGFQQSYVWTSTHLGYLALREGRVTEAHTIFADASKNFQKDQSAIGVAFALEGIASLDIVVGKHDLAARLIGWADNTRQEMNDLRPPVEQEDVDKIIAACLFKMGEVAFSDVYDEGQKMSLDEAIAYALKEN